MPHDPEFLGRGWSFPPSFSRAAASTEMVTGAEDIHQSLWILLSTYLGERVMVPSYGCLLTPLVFEDVSISFVTDLRDRVKTAILEWEPRIDVEEITAEADREEPGLVRVNIDYSIRKTNTRNNLVYPFYLHEATLAPPAP